MSSLLTNITLGADPELFVKDITTGKFVPSLDLIGGTKHDPRPLSVPGFFAQEDNVLVEYNIPPSKTKESFRENIRLGMRLFEEVLPKDKYSVEVKTSHKFLPEQLLDPRADEFGCDPDRNAWLNGELNPPPCVLLDGLRSAGGHIHVGYELDNTSMGIMKLDANDKEVINRNIVRWMDLLLAVPSMKIDKDLDRRKLYGKAGAYRDKSFGVEYRTLSSFWLSSPSLIDWVWEMTQKAVTHVGNIELIDDSESEAIMAAVNLNDQYAIDHLFKKYDLKMF